MRKILLTSFFSLLLVYTYSQELTDQVENSIKKEVRLHPDVHLKYAHTSFSIDRYVVKDPYILIYSNTTGSLYLINQENQLIVDQLDIFKEFKRLKVSNIHVWDKETNARVRIRSPFLNTGLASSHSNLEPFNDSLYYAGIIKQKNNYNLLLVHFSNDKIKTVLKEFNLTDKFIKPKGRKIELHDFYIKHYLKSVSEWKNNQLFFYAIDPYVKKLPEDSTYRYKTLHNNSIYTQNNNKLTSIFKLENTSNFISDANYITQDNKLLVFSNDLDSIFLYSDNLKLVKQKKIPRVYYDTITIKNKKFITKHGSIIKDGFNDMIYIFVSSFQNKTYSIYSTDTSLEQFTLIKTFVSDLALYKNKVYNGKLFFLISTNASETEKLFSYDLYKSKELGDTILINSSLQNPFSLFRGNLKKLWFKNMFGLENIKSNVYNLPKNLVKNKIDNSKLSDQEVEKQKSIEGLIDLINETYKENKAEKILANYTCYDKFENEILAKSVKKESFSAKTDSIFYKTNLKELFESIAQPDFKPIGEMKTYHYEIITDDGWHLFLAKIKYYWYLSSVVYKEED